ncbi:MAG: DUF2723 domain-containing protein [Candidatus Omnitrophota bacterium]|nr:MAG: DUF2723 domain-containing protein [Candidatus Omnitrophota bacterium]
MKNEWSDNRNKRLVFTAAGLCLVSLLLFIISIPQDIVWGDCPELAAGAWTLGVPHPTGYSSYILTTRLFQWLPFGTVAFRGHLFSAVCASLSCSILFLFLYRCLSEGIGEKGSLTLVPAAASAFACILTPVIWSQAQITEVYALFVLQFALLLLLLYEFKKNPARVFAPLAFVTGLALMHHRLIVFLLPIAGILFVTFMNREFNAKRNRTNTTSALLHSSRILCKTGFLFFIPFLLLLYYPLRAWKNPPLNWYDPDTPHRLLQLLSGEQYSGVLQNGIRNVLHNFSSFHLYQFFAMPLLCYSWLAIPILIGLFVLFRRQLWMGLTVLYIFVVYQLFMICYLVGDWQVYLIPALIVLTIPLTFGLASILTAIQKKWNGFAYKTFLLLFCIAALLPLFVPFDEPIGLIGQSLPPNPFPLSFESAINRFLSVYDASTADYAEQVFHLVPPGIPIITGLFEFSADNEYYPLLYQQIVEQKRLDSPLIGAGFLYLDWYRREMNRLLNLDLPMRNDQRSLDRNHWHEDTWQTVVLPLIIRESLASTSHPLPSDWQSRCRIEVAGMTTFDRNKAPANIAWSYRRYLPFRYIYRLSIPSAENKE